MIRRFVKGKPVTARLILITVVPLAMFFLMWPADGIKTAQAAAWFMFAGIALGMNVGRGW